MAISQDRILYDDPHLLIVTKRSGELIVKGSGKTQELPLYDFLHRDYPGLRVVHRLDFETSGIVVFAKTKGALDSILATKFAGWKKTYQTLVLGRLPKKAGEIDKPLPARTKGVVEAQTLYKVLEEVGPVTFAEAEIESGRFHQIRRHFASIKHPLLLDHEYCTRAQNKLNQRFAQAVGYHRFFLHSARLTFPHPVTHEELHIEAPLPLAFQSVLKKLRKSA